MRSLFSLFVCVCAVAIVATAKTGQFEPTVIAQVQIQESPLKHDHAHIIQSTLRNLGFDFIAKELIVFLSSHEVVLLDRVLNRYPFAKLKLLASREFATTGNREPIVTGLFSNVTSVPDGYKKLDTLNSYMFNLQTQYPAIAKVIDIAKEYGTGATIEGRPIYALFISSNASQIADKPSILIASCHHAREITTPEMALHAMMQLTTGWSKKDPFFLSLLEKYQFVIVPVVNPDGYNYVFTQNNWWRKNRRHINGNVYGVDLNRNYELGWSTCVPVYPPSSETYKGTAPYSEPETTAMAGLSNAFSFAKVLDFHSYGREVLNGYECTKMPSLIRNYINSNGVMLSKFAQYGTRVPSDDGEHQEFQIKNFTTFAHLVEMGTSFQPKYSEAVAEVSRVWPLVQRFFNISIPLQGHVLDRDSKAPLVARIEVAGIDWLAGESRYSHKNFGFYHMFLPIGAYQLTFSAPGYQSQTVPVKITDPSFGTTVVNDVLLVKQ